MPRQFLKNLLLREGNDLELQLKRGFQKRVAGPIGRHDNARTDTLNTTLSPSGSAAEYLLVDSTVGNFPCFYGGSFPGSFRIVLNATQAANAVLGAPGTRPSSTAGNEAASPAPSGTGFRWAFADLQFGTGFDASSNLYLRELGNNSESAYLFLWVHRWWQRLGTLRSVARLARRILHARDRRRP